MGTLGVGGAKRNRTKVVGFRVTPQEHLALQLAQRTTGHRSIDSFLRNQLMVMEQVYTIIRGDGDAA